MSLTRLDSLGRSALFLAASRCQTSAAVIKLLLEGVSTRGISRRGQAKEMAKVVDNRGRLPFLGMIASGRNFDEGMKDLFEAAPMAIAVQDPLTGLYPFALAAAGRHKVVYTRTALPRTVENTYLLLREAPWLAPLSSLSVSTVESVSTRHSVFFHWTRWNRDDVLLAASWALVLLLIMAAPLATNYLFSFLKT